LFCCHWLQCFLLFPVFLFLAFECFFVAFVAFVCVYVFYFVFPYLTMKLLLFFLTGKVPMISSNQKPVVAIGKHLCGAATGKYMYMLKLKFCSFGLFETRDPGNAL
jgi:hypothetical protein